MRCRKHAGQFIAILCMSLSLTGCISQPSLFPSIGPLEESRVAGEGEQKIVMINIEGMLTSAKPSGFADKLFDRPSLPARVKEELTKAGKDDQVKAILLHINSPGGTVTASDILYHEIQQFKKTHDMPVIASIVDLGTSGGYYLAAAADHIAVHPSTITGSIGVIMVTINAEGLLEKIGVEPRAIMSGPKKSMGAPFRSMTEEEHAIFQGVIDSMYDQFLTVVKTGRPDLDDTEIRRLADGRIYTATQAKDAGLIDSIGYLEDAIAVAKQQAGLDDAQVVTYHRAGGYKHNIYSSMMIGGEEIQKLSDLKPLSLLTLLNGSTPQFLYMWIP
ncbi:MAG: signal peptide peptidase SppA [Nitrospirales bacterium]|nr:MAG: signal peptide peptidase SppA [Nitrospirales bacterium]